MTRSVWSDVLRDETGARKARIGRWSLLPDVLGKVLVSEAVVSECVRDRSEPGAMAIQHALDNSLLVARRVERAPEWAALAQLLDPGEAKALTLAVAENLPVLMDERRGRGVALHLGVPVLGTGTVLIAAKQAGLWPAFLTTNLLRPRNCPHLPAVSSSESSTGVGAGFTGDPRNRPCGPASPKGFGSYRGPAGIYGHLRWLATICGENCGPVKAVAPLLEALQDRGYRLSESLVGAILKRCEEGEER